MNNLNRVQNIFISDGTACPANNAAITSVSSGDVAVYGSDWTALNPAGADTISTQPSIFIVEGKTNSDGNFYLKKSTKIDGSSVISYKGTSYAPSVPEVWAIGYNRKTATGTIEVNDSTNYEFVIRFKNDKQLYSERPEVQHVNFTSASSATQLSIATQIAASINNGSYRTEISAIVVGNGTGVYGVTGATNYGVEITAKEIEQYLNVTYTLNQVYFSVFVNDASGFGTTTTCTQIQAFDSGSGTYNQIYTLENKCLSKEGVVNRRLWPIPALDYSTTTSYQLSAAITPVATGTSGQDKVTFDLTVASILRAGEKVEIDGVNYTIKYFISSTVAILTSVLTTSPASAATKVRYKYDMITIEYNDAINGPTGVVAVSNKIVTIAVPALDAGDAYSGLSLAGTDLKAILDTWMASTPRAFANISI